MWCYLHILRLEKRIIGDKGRGSFSDPPDLPPRNKVLNLSPIGTAGAARIVLARQRRWVESVNLATRVDPWDAVAQPSK